MVRSKDLSKRFDIFLTGDCFSSLQYFLETIYIDIRMSVYAAERQYVLHNLYGWRESLSIQVCTAPVCGLCYASAELPLLQVPVLLLYHVTFLTHS